MLLPSPSPFDYSVSVGLYVWLSLRLHLSLACLYPTICLCLFCLYVRLCLSLARRIQCDLGSSPTTALWLSQDVLIFSFAQGFSGMPWSIWYCGSVAVCLFVATYSLESRPTPGLRHLQYFNAPPPANQTHPQPPLIRTPSNSSAVPSNTSSIKFILSRL